jgi:hypothetical protein
LSLSNANFKGSKGHKISKRGSKGSLYQRPPQLTLEQGEWLAKRKKDGREKLTETYRSLPNKC